MYKKDIHWVEPLLREPTEVPARKLRERSAQCKLKALSNCSRPLYL